MRKALQHRLNAQHIRCFLLELGFSLRASRKAAIWWERIAHPFLYKRLLLVCFCTVFLTGCPAWMQGVGVKFGPEGVALTYGTPEFEEQLKGVGSWAEWLAGASLEEAKDHLPGVAAWAKDLSRAVGK